MKFAVSKWLYITWTKLCENVYCMEWECESNRARENGKKNVWKKVKSESSICVWALAKGIKDIRLPKKEERKETDWRNRGRLASRFYAAEPEAFKTAKDNHSGLNSPSPNPHSLLHPPPSPAPHQSSPPYTTVRQSCPNGIQYIRTPKIWAPPQNKNRDELQL